MSKTEPMSSALRQVPAGLPVHLTRFVGRGAELATVGALLRDRRVVTLTGAGGAGKTRLAAQVAADHAGHWPDGVSWVDLAPVMDADEVSHEVAEALGVLVAPVRGPLWALTVQLRDRRVLLCLDNCEQVIDGAAEVAEAVVRSCPGVTVMATSREPLNVPGEVVWHVPPLAEDEAVALFVDRARMVRTEFALDEAADAAVRRMVARLDGMPLALELSAAWLRTLTPQQIAAGLDDRFALLVRGSRTAPARQHTLAASIDWSHALLGECERIVFRRLAVFPAWFDVEAARAVCAAGKIGRDDVLPLLAGLIDKSLVVAEQRDGRARYRLLESIRLYAADRLAEAGEAAATRDRHLDHFLALAEAIEPQRHDDMDVWRTRLTLEHDNLRAALDWGLADDDPERGRRLAAALAWLWHVDRHGHEGIDHLTRALRRAPDDRTRLQARLLTGLALVVDTARPLDLEFDAAQRALEIATEVGDDRLRALCLALSAVGQFYTDFDAAWTLADEAKATADAAGDAFAVDASRALQGMILHLRDRHGDAEPLLQSAVDGLLRRHRGIAATTLGFQAGSALYTGDIKRALRLAERAVAVAEPLGDHLRVGGARSILAFVRGLAGGIDAGLEIMQPVLRLVEGAENEVFISQMPRVMGALHLWRDEPDRAAAWFEREAHATDRGQPTWLAAQAMPGLATALARLGRIGDAHAVVERAITVAGTLDMPRVLADALDLQAELISDDDPGRALDLHYEALAIRVDHGLRTFCVDSLDALAALGDGPEAARLLGASEQARQTLGYPRDPPRQQAHDGAVSSLRSTLGETTFRRAWDEGRQLCLTEAVAYARRSRGSRRRPATGWESLTPTELDVVRLVVDGLSNPEIGARLFISRGTVKTHLSHVYAKVGVANRTGLATFAAPRLADRRK